MQKPNMHNVFDDQVWFNIIFEGLLQAQGTKTFDLGGQSRRIAAGERRGYNLLSKPLVEEDHT